MSVGCSLVKINGGIRNVQNVRVRVCRKVTAQLPDATFFHLFVICLLIYVFQLLLIWSIMSLIEVVFAKPFVQLVVRVRTHISSRSFGVVQVMFKTIWRLLEGSGTVSLLLTWMELFLRFGFQKVRRTFDRKRTSQKQNSHPYAAAAAAAAWKFSNLPLR